MAKLFRKGRFNFFQGKGVGQYLLYILLEMVLVVAGILIALEINNANEVRKEQEKTTILLSQVERDLRINLKQLEDIQETLEQRDSIMAILLKGELSWPEFKANPVHSVLIAS